MLRKMCKPYAIKYNFSEYFIQISIVRLRRRKIGSFHIKGCVRWLVAHCRLNQKYSKFSRLIAVCATLVDESAISWNCLNKNLDHLDFAESFCEELIICCWCMFENVSASVKPILEPINSQYPPISQYQHERPSYTLLLWWNN